ncbi:uncharacterized protein LOC130703990 [Daphnia carinata]|uniref:uncharacterized protein LOC130703990 n=1 Tax=Daphnia carinata TaxID=120202 RepID=UPI00257F1AAB|nr:uncharacterized protein LOC130703990 [Daphnia carinata]
MVCVFTILRGILVIALAGLSCSVCAVTLKQHFQHLRNDCVRTKELLEGNIVRLEKVQAQLETLELKAQQHSLLEEVLFDQFEDSSAKLQEKMLEYDSEIQQEENLTNVPQVSISSTVTESIPNDAIGFIQEIKGPVMETSDPARLIPVLKGVFKMDYNSFTLN